MHRRSRLWRDSASPSTDWKMMTTKQDQRHWLWKSRWGVHRRRRSSTPRSTTRRCGWNTRTESTRGSSGSPRRTRNWTWRRPAVVVVRRVRSCSRVRYFTAVPTSWTWRWVCLWKRCASRRDRHTLPTASTTSASVYLITSFISFPRIPSLHRTT